jgi:hypothetical protein
MVEMATRKMSDRVSELSELIMDDRDRGREKWEQMEEEVRQQREREQKGKEKGKLQASTTNTSKWEAGKGLSLFQPVAKKGVGENGVAFMELGEWRANHPESIVWEGNSRNAHEYKHCWELLGTITNEEAAVRCFERMAELAAWNKFGWGPTKEAFGIAEQKDIGVAGPNMQERLEKAKKLKEKEEREREKKKEAEKTGSTGKGGSWNEGGNRRPGFRGTCHICGMYGHSAKFCRNAAGNGGGGFQGVCFNCQQWGHSARFCTRGPARVTGGMGAGMFNQYQQGNRGWDNKGGQAQGQGQGQQGLQGQQAGLGFTK